MKYTVQPGDSLWTIAQDKLGSGERWREIALLNGLDGSKALLVGQVLLLPPNAQMQTPPKTGTGASSGNGQPSGHLPPQKRPATTVVRAFFFVIADELNPFARKVVRKVIYPKQAADPALLKQILNPERHGFTPRDAKSNVSMGRHVLGRTDSRYVSASDHPMGSPTRAGKPYWIDAERVKASGATIHEIDELLKDLDRIAAKTKKADFLAYIESIKKISIADREVLIEGKIPPSAVKGPLAMGATRGFQFVQGVGIVLTIRDLGKAGIESYRSGSIRPIAGETTRQVGGWGGAVAGAELFGSAGALFGIETGPGAVITAGAGGMIGGVAGYFGADWIVRLLDKKAAAQAGH